MKQVQKCRGARCLFIYCFTIMQVENELATVLNFCLRMVSRNEPDPSAFVS